MLAEKRFSNRVLFIGRNGSGKTTLMNAISPFPDNADRLHIINVSNSFLPHRIEDAIKLVNSIVVSRQISPLRIECARSTHDVDEAVISHGLQQIEYQSVPSLGDTVASMRCAALSRELLHERQWG
jgi:ABC-type molybdenum transport system ATPase subunit/photorepair protein PhrA